MEYTITDLGKLAGISTRTLRFYDAIDLLRPVSLNHAGYRVYGQNEVNLLQQILFYRALGFPLSQIKSIVTASGFDSVQALHEHKAALLKEKARIERLIEGVEETLNSQKEENNMANEKKFKALKEKNISDNDQKYGKEIREKYGNEIVDESHKKYRDMDPETFARAQKLAKEIMDLLIQAMDEKDIHSETAKKLVVTHKEWLMIYWPKYSAEAHRGLADTYVHDERFTKFYDNSRHGAAQFLRNAIYEHAKE
jgi:DNA-binding transcriptional MerR regulator